MNANINPLMTYVMIEIMTDFDPAKIADTYRVPEFNVSKLIDA